VNITGLHGVKSQEIVLFMVTAVTTSNPTKFRFSDNVSYKPNFIEYHSLVRKSKHAGRQMGHPHMRSVLIIVKLTPLSTRSLTQNFHLLLYMMMTITGPLKLIVKKAVQIRKEKENIR
jgi:hypothetical protein